MEVHLVDGTYELFRHFHGQPSRKASDGGEIAAVRGVLLTVLKMLDETTTHIAVATDHVVESFRNELWPGYKDSSGIPPELLAQFELLEEALTALGVVVWPMVDVEADDALASAATLAGASSGVERIVICSPDKDLAQCVVGQRVVQLDRRSGTLHDEAGVVEKFGDPSRDDSGLACSGRRRGGWISWASGLGCPFCLARARTLRLDRWRTRCRRRVGSCAS